MEYEVGERGLIAAILLRAQLDASSWNRNDKPDQAMKFINKDNKLFCHYCNLLDMNADYLSIKMHKQIKIDREINLIKLKEREMKKQNKKDKLLLEEGCNLLDNAFSKFDLIQNDSLGIAISKVLEGIIRMREYAKLNNEDILND